MATSRNSSSRARVTGRAPRTTRAGSRRRVSKRSGIVWGAFLGAMIFVGGGLYLADAGHLSTEATDGITPMLATASVGAQGVDSIFRTGTPVPQGRWQAIVIHDSGQLAATPSQMDEAARRQGLRGLGYQFVIGNGNGMADGELFVSQRWMDQTPGAHAAGDNADWFNRNAIGICLVGDGNRQRFTAAQSRRLHETVRALCERLGIPADRVYLHSQIAPTSSPGRLFQEAALRQALMGISGR
ncbi:MAG: peptidoglycan recognition family protein [Phycisphaerales bacterium]